MRYLIILTLAFFLSNCGKPKTVLICGDHICINKAEAEQYFEENLSIQVKIIDRKDKNEINLVQLNLNNRVGEKRSVSVSKKNQENKNLKNLSNKEISEIKKEIKDKKLKKIVKKPSIKKNEKYKKKLKKQKKSNKNSKDIADVCTILKKCSIDEISKYLLKQGKKKSFPDITIRQ
tara:strand:+ start:281 stop:808 length:528 start_codon:yes stop_codon:yes gene_type:complete